MQKIWDEVGESNGGREEILQQIEQECLQVYKRKVDQAASIRTRLQKSLSDAEAELASLISRLGDRPLLGRVSSHIVLSLIHHIIHGVFA